jgi:hypothetical protein
MKSSQALRILLQSDLQDQPSNWKLYTLLLSERRNEDLAMVTNIRPKLATMYFIFLSIVHGLGSYQKGYVTPHWKFPDIYCVS